ncbi:MAG: ATP-binding cassette domain-containing protein [Gemmatimonadota bacterium]|nr:ATP-binding cassette domain-containing protein [Gemmatimonadota bacterium]
MTALADTLELQNISKRYGSTVALAGASLIARPGALHVLLGENGAGKTTLLRVASGLTTADAGSIIHRGHAVRWQTRAAALNAGISIVQQHFSLVPAMTVAENVALADRGMLARFSMASAAAHVRHLCAEVGLDLDPGATVGTLSVSAQQRVEIVKTIAHGAPVLILDEPTAVLSPSEAESLFEWLRGFAAMGHTVIAITHRIREAMRFADSITVLRGGKTVFASDGPFTDDRPLLEAILGESRGLDDRMVEVPSTPGSGSGRDIDGVAVSLAGVSVTDGNGVPRLRDVNCSIRAGAIVGVAGVEGAGQRELLRVIAGRLVPTAGSVVHDRQAGFVPEDRQREAVIPEFSLTENFALRGSGARRGLIRWSVIASETKAAMQRADVRAASAESAAQTLSGGNQQRFVFARETVGAPRVIVAENPTRGLDVRAAAEMVRRLRDARDAGAAIVVYSSDVHELVALADRALVCFGGAVREVAVSAEAIGSALVGAS